MEDTFKRKFTYSTKAWYANNLKQRSDFEDEISIGLYSEQGGTAGEFAIRWYKLGDSKGASPRLECFNDAWKVLYKDFGDLLELLSIVDGLNITPNGLIKHLKAFDIEDKTEYDYPGSKQEETKSKTFALTMKVNDYDQYGEYLIKLWEYEPCDAEIEDAINLHKTQEDSPIPHDLELDFESIRNEEGRLGTEKTWFYLRKSTVLA